MQNLCENYILDLEYHGFKKIEIGSMVDISMIKKQALLQLLALCDAIKKQS
jgi:hypothetical protein